MCSPHYTTVVPPLFVHQFLTKKKHSTYLKWFQDFEEIKKMRQGTSGYTTRRVAEIIPSVETTLDNICGFRMELLRRK